MKGKILDFSIANSEGVISGDDGNRYTFGGRDWKSSTPPQAGQRVDFDGEGRTAVAVYLDQAAGAGGAGATSDSLYKSSDDKMLAGVCAGLAHGWKISCPGMRIATVAVTLFTGVPLILYIVCIFVLPARPTRNVP